jgi:hypothetical protein
MCYSSSLNSLRKSRTEKLRRKRSALRRGRSQRIFSNKKAQNCFSPHAKNHERTYGGPSRDTNLMFVAIFSAISEDKSAIKDMVVEIEK